MGIKDGTRIKAHLRSLGAGVLEHESMIRSTSRSYMEADVWIIDCMLDIYTKPPFVKTGKQLTRWYFNKIISALLLNKTVVLICDDSRRVPQNKAACQKKRRSNAPSLPDGLTITDDGELPEWYSLLSSGKYRLMIFEYLLMGLSAHVDGMTTEHEGCLFVSRPWARQSLYDTTWLSGGFVEVTRTGRPMPSSTCVHGEGDMLCRVWSDFFAQENPNAKIVIKSKDLDMLGIYAAKNPLGDCQLHITTTKGKNQQMEFVRVKRLHSRLLKTRERALSFVYALILAGSDYCEGVYGVSGLNLVKTALDTPNEEQVIQCYTKRPKVDKRFLEKLVTRSSKKQGAFNMKKQRLSYCRANWNLDYWMSNTRVPDPLKYGGWQKQADGFMPIVT
jgi:hypothetical protein